jgi:GT2 family glycosyltransferase
VSTSSTAASAATKTEPATLALGELSVVVLSYNRREELRQNLEALCALRERTGFELIVVDNASTDGTRDDLQQLRIENPGVVILQSERNLGVAGGRNLGWRAATRPFILNLDDDTRIDLDAMLALHRAAAASESIGAVTPRVVHAETGRCQNGDYAGKIREPANFHGACHLVRTSAWKSAGPLDPGCRFGGEELDYAIRLRAAGYSTVCLGDVVVRHNSLTRGNSVDRWRREQWLYNYSRVLFKHFPAGRALACSSRGLMSHLLGGVAAHGIAIAPALIGQAIRGALAGRQRYARLPPAALRFYSNDELLPDFGNIPLWRKMRSRLSRARASAYASRATVCRLSEPRWPRQLVAAKLRPARESTDTSCAAVRAARSRRSRAEPDWGSRRAPHTDRCAANRRYGCRGWRTPHR